MNLYILYTYVYQSFLCLCPIRTRVINITRGNPQLDRLYYNNNVFLRYQYLLTELSQLFINKLKLKLQLYI